MQVPDGRLHNFMSYAHEVEGYLDSGDHLGRTLWATRCVVDSVLPEGIRRSAKEVFDKALPWSIRSTSIRVKAHAIKGLCRYCNCFRNDPNPRKNLSQLVGQIVAT